MEQEHNDYPDDGLALEENPTFFQTRENQEINQPD